MRRFGKGTRGPLSKRKRLDNCLICNKDPSVDVINGEIYRKLLIEYLIPTSKMGFTVESFDKRIFNFCNDCNRITRTLSHLKEELDAILRKISSKVNSIKFRMIMQKSSGDVDIDYFRYKALCDLRPKVRLERCNIIIKQKCVKIRAQKKTTVKCSNSEINEDNVAPRVRMDLNNSLIEKTPKISVNNDPQCDSQFNKEVSKKSGIDNRNAATKDVLESILLDSETDSSNDGMPEVNGSRREGNIDKLSDEKSEDLQKLNSEDGISSEIVSENKECLYVEENDNIEAKEYPLLVEIDQFNPWNEPSSPVGEVTDPLDVQEESFSQSSQFNSINIETESNTTQFEGATRNVEETKQRPSITCNYLIVLAIKNSKSNVLRLEDIYNFITENYPYYRTAKPNWKAIIRKCLTNTQYFWKVSSNEDDISEKPMSLNGWWAVHTSQCSSVRNAIALLCEKNKHLMEFPERLKEFITALFKDNAVSEQRAEKALVSPTSYTERPDITLHGMIYEYLDKGKTGETEVKVHPDVKLEMAVPNVIEIKPKIKLENEVLNNDATSASTCLPQIVDSYSCETIENQNNSVNEMGVTTKVPTIALASTSSSPQPNSIQNENYATSKYIRPTFSHSQLAILALANSSNADNTLGTRQIIEFIAENFPYYRTENSWKKLVYETLNTNRCYFKRNFEQGKAGPLISWSIDENEPHYSQIRLQILSSLKESLSVNYQAAISYDKLEEIVRKALGSNCDLSFLKNPALVIQPPYVKVAVCKPRWKYKYFDNDSEKTAQQAKEAIAPRNPMLVENGNGYMPNAGR